MNRARPVLHRAQPLTEQDKQFIGAVEAANRRYRFVRPAPPKVIREAELADAEMNRPARHYRIDASPPIHWVEMAIMLLSAAFIGAMLAVGGVL